METNDLAMPQAARAVVPDGIEPLRVSPVSASIPIAGTSRRKVWPLGGYAPGNYMGTCRDCGSALIADKRARQCLDCAVISANARIEVSETLATRMTEQNGRLRIALWNELRRAGVPQDAAIEIVRQAADGPAQGIEAAPADETGTGSAEGESPVGSADAPKE